MAKSRDSVSDVIEKLLGDVTDRGKEAIAEVVDEAKGLKRKAKELELDELVDDVKGYVKKNPLKSLGIAVGVGFVLGSLLKSSRGDE